MKNSVRIKDFDRKTHLTMNALRLCGLDINYTTTDLIVRTLKVLAEKDDQFTVKDGANIQVSHEKYWDEYFKKLKSEEEKENKKA